MENLDKLNELYEAKHLDELEKVIAYTFNNKNLLVVAMLHSSFKGRLPEVDIDNERFEFLGDSVLNFIIVKYLFSKYKDKDEGFLSIKKNKFISKDFLNSLGRLINMEKYVIVASNNILENKGVIEDAMEALFAAVFLDGGISKAKKVILTLFNRFSEEIDEELDVFNAKQILQEFFLKEYGVLPKYKTFQEPNGESFRAQIIFKEDIVSEGFGHNKKDAEKEAAYFLCRKFGLM